ncbi:obscurin isoform X6 [Prorops nasuta]|uniref:obscurin isoform X6 n=1 Tax=Prorops nasuta TaxID=863751 RepID=UPI0034CFF737
MSFCRITGRSKGLPKPNYFPLLPPISPADAKRFCRITGKSYGLPSHHYIPVLLASSAYEKSKCKITNASGLGPHHYTAGVVVAEKRKHVVLKDYRYVFPILEGEGEQQKVLRDLLKTKNASSPEEETSKFVYTVQERRCSLVFPAQLEAAVRDGDVRDVMLSKDRDSVLLRLKQGKNVSVDFVDLKDYQHLYDGLGPQEEVLKEREAEVKRKKRKRKGVLDYAKRIFEEKERAEDEEFAREQKMSKPKLNSIREDVKHERIEEWTKVSFQNAKQNMQKIMQISGKSSLVHEDLEKTLDWTTKKQREFGFLGKPLISRIPDSVNVEVKAITPKMCVQNIVYPNEKTCALETIPVVSPFEPCTVLPDPNIREAIEALPERTLESTADVCTKISGEDISSLLPSLQDIAEISKCLVNGEPEEVRKVKGLKLDIGLAKKFVCGQHVQTPSGSIFVPGQTLPTPQGLAFVPGFTVHTPEGPMLLPGQIVEDKSGERVFVAGVHEEGGKFVQGQTVITEEGPKFIQGQTVLSEEGPKFVAGLVANDGSFVPGQTIDTPQGPKFLPGQSIVGEHGELLFVPGQSAKINDEWEFVPGQCLETPNCEVKFVPGRIMDTAQGQKFIPGQNCQDDSGEIIFLPGVTAENGEFLPGAIMDTPKGTKFVQGQVLKTPEGNRFVPGRFKVTENGFEFAAATNLDEVLLTEVQNLGIPLDDKVLGSVSSSLKREIFGHMVQTEMGIEFVPENSRKLPEGKRTVPGQLVRDKDTPRFVPGIKTDDGFLPGQVVMTEKGEQFVPGQVVDTSDGPKFVPGQMVDTKTGQKFVPGQIVETTDGPRFVPGQIVETKAGPTFIPGQIISTDDKGSRFVPGQVVDTSDGPRFVPGRVVESGEGVIFVPGQIVQTEEGPRFVAPDLIGTSDGEFEFSVQGFEVTPEELSLLRLHNVHYHPQHHDTSIDARMLRQLSEAGLSVGRKVKEELPEVNVDIDPRAMALEQALVLSEKLGLRGNSAVKMAQVVSTVAQLAKNIQEQYECIEDPYRLANGTSSEHEESSHISDSDWLQEATKAAMATAILALDDEDSNQDYVHSAITEAFNVLLRRHNSDLENSVEEILRLLLVPENRGKLCQAAMVDVLSSRSSKVDILRSTVRGRSLKDEVVLERLSMVLEEDHDSIGSAFRTVSRGDPELLSSVLKRVSEGVGDVETEQDATETVRKAIVQAVRESSEQTVRELLNDERSKVREMLLQAVGLARALGMTSVAGSLLAVISDSESTKALSGDKVTLDVLKRLTVMRKLAEESPRYSSALRQLCSDPEIARADPSLRALVRESAALMIVPEEVPLHSSADIPTTLLNSDNSLAIEDFLIRRGRRRSSTFMILKQGMQAVVPREAARSVLTGEVPYTVLDEDGIRHFEPLHVFSALKLKDQTAHRFSMYCCPVAKEDDLDNDALSSYTGITSIDSIDTMINEHGECNGVVFSPSDRSIGYSASRENTPSFRRLSSILQDSTSDGKSPENFVVVKEHNEDGFSVHVGDIVEAIEYSERAKKPRVDPEFQIGEIAPTLDNSAAKHRISIRPRRNHSVPRSRVVTRSSSDSNLQRIYARTTDGREGWLPTTILMQTALSEDSSTITSHRTEDSHYRREAVIKELVETEEEFGRDLQLVVERYLKPLDNLSVPRIVRDNKDIIFTNFKQIADFHNTSFGRVLIEGVNYYADQPRMLGKTFLRLERDFDKHVAYCRDEPLAQEFLQTNDEVREYFEELSQNLGDDKSVSEHLKLPIQRINDYQLLLKELVKYSTRLGENCDDLQKALDLMLGIPHKATDNKFLSNIEGFKGNIYKLGRLISHEWFTIVDREDKSKERYLFLFKARILVCKVRRISEDRSVFVLKDIIRLPEVEVKDDPKDDRCFELYNPSIPNYPITLIAHKDYVKDFWLKEIREYASDLVALAEHAADDLQLAEVKEESKPEEKGVPVKVVPSPLKRKIEEVGKVERTEEEVKKSKDSPAKVEEVKEKSSKVEKSQVERVKGESVKVQQVREEKLKDSGESVKAVTEVKEVTKKEGIKEAIKTEVGKEKVEPTKPEVAKETSKSNLDTGKQEKGLKEERSNPGEKVAENPGKPEGKLVNVEDSKAEMSRRYSSSRYSSSAKVVEEYSSVSSSTHGMSYTESSVSSSNARAAASYQSSNLATERIAESSSSYTSAIGTSSNSKIEDSKTAKISLGATNTGKPKFAKTIEGCNVEPSRETKALIHVIAGECATFECSLSSSDAANRILWLKDNKPLEDKLADRVTTTAFDDKRYKLEIQNVHEADSGIYTARATNSDGVTTCTAQLVVQELTAEERKARAEANAPIFLVRLKDTELLENTYLRFMIKVKGDPNPALKFFKDGVLIDSNNSRVKIIDEKSDKGFYELVIVDVQKEDAGKYSCTATNRFGDTSCEAQVTVTDEKAIFAGLPEGLLAPGEEPQFTWLRDGQPFDPEERFKVLFKDNEDTLALVFQHVKPEDAGLYTCVAQTSTGNISCSAELTVQGAVNQLAKDPEKPKLESESRTSEVNVGGSAMLDLQVKGYPKPDIKWTKDGEEIIAGGRIKYLWEDEESLSLVIKHVTAKDAGVYTIKAKNELGEDETQIELIVKSAPKVVQRQNDINALVDDVIEMILKIEATPAPEVKWYKDGQLMEESDRIQIVKEGNDTYKLIIKGGRLLDGGSYSIVAKNEINQTSEMWNLSVTSPPRIKKGLGEPKIVNVGENLTLKIEIDSQIESSVTWLKDEEVLVEDDRVKLSHDGDDYILKITGTVSTDAARYKVKATNQYGTVSDETRVKVHGIPRFKVKLQDTTVKEGDVDVEFNVQIESYPKPTVQWFFGDCEITEKREEFSIVEDGDNCKLILKEVKSELKGKYSCKVANEYGESSCEATLTVNTKPKMTKKLSDVKVKEGDTLKLHVEVTGTPDPEIKWFKDGEEVSADTRIKITRDKKRKESYDLTVTLIKGSDGGVYEVRAQNEMGEVSCKSKVTIMTKTEEKIEEVEQEESSQKVQEEDLEKYQQAGVEATPEIVTSNLEDRTIFETQTTCFEVKVTGLPRPDGKWFKDGKQVRSSDRLRIEHVSETFKLTLSRAQSDDEGIYSFVATNKLGEKTVEGFLTVASVAELRKPRFIEPLEDTDVADGATGEFKAVFTADPVPEISWSYNGSEISPEDERIKMTLKTKPATSDKLTECSVSLSVPEVKAGDTGEYSLFLINKHGEAEASARLDLLLRPEVQKFEDHSAPLEEITQWEVVVVGNPKPKIMWVKGEDTEIQQSDKHELSEDRRNNKYTLKINGVDFDDAGTYKVVAENFLGDASAQAELKILTMEPTFVAELSDVHSDDREDIELKLRADGIPKPKVKWLKDGVAINQDDRHFVATYDEGQVATSLFIKHFSLEDVGTITCEATNCVGKAETSCQLIMNKKKPTFNRLLPRSAELDEGEPLEFKIKIEGSPIPGISWLKDGEPVVPDDHIQIETLPDGSSKLSIDRIKPTDCGAYKVIAKNSSGEESSLCAVAVKPAPSKPSFTQPLENVKVMSGEPLRLEARVVAFPNPQIQWFKDGLPVRPTKEISFINDPNGLIGLTIDKVTPEDAGAYSLVAWNSLGEITGLSNVDVEEKERRPDFLSSLQPVTVVEGFPAKLEVKTLGKPVPTIKWTHNGEEIVPDGEHFKVISQPDGTVALLIDKATPEDAGEYSAIASNDLGEAACSTKLQVAGKSRSDVPEEKPSFLCPMRDVSVEEGQPLLLTATFVGNPIPDVTWTKDDKPVELSDIVALSCDGKRLSLEINPSHVNDAGVYKCKISSPLGDDESSAQATVRKVFQPPKFTQKFTDLQQLPNYDAKFPARINGVPRPDITWYFNDNPILKDDDKYKIKRDGDICCLYVKDCAPEDSGKYTCKAVNKDGEAECSARLDVVEKIDRSKKVEPPSFMKRIGDCEIYRGMAAKFTACVTGIPEPEFEWFKDNEKMWPSDRIQMDQEGSLLRLTIRNVDDLDAGTYRLRIFNPHGEDSCSADLIYESLEPRSKRPLSDQYTDYDKYRRSGIPLPLADRPIISRMMDRHLTLSWKPSIPIGPRVPVTYLVEMCELPDGDWFTARSGIRSCICDIRNLVPFRDYKFRVRVENKYGISDPSPFAQTYRSKLEPDPPKFFPYLAPGIDFRPETSPYFPKDFDIERPPHDGYAQAPRFLRQEYDTQYGVKNHNCSLFWFVYGYPKPRMTYYFNDELIECGGRYDQSYTRNGQATLFINKMLERDEGIYEAVATNEHGEARQRVKLACAEYPTFIQRPEETVVMLRRNGTLTARVTGVPYPDIKWFKDWKPITTSSRIKIQFVEPDTSILSLSEAIAKDEGLYSISAGNVAGSVSSSAMVHIEMNEQEWNYRTYRRKPDIKTKERPVIDLYDLGDELGRGTQGVTYHAVERSTGKNFAAKVMHGLREHRPFMHNEMDVMNNLNHKKLLRLHDAYENDNTMTLITELAAGGELADNLMKQTSYTEYEIAGYIRQILWGLEHMHDSHYAHLGLTLNDLLISHPGGDNLKIGDFGLARRISSAKLMTLNYGVPEYVAPEVSNNEGVSYPADMWSVGIITYILLSGISPFRGTNDKETLLRIRDGRWEFDERWTNISNEARDFVRSLLIYQPEKRLNVRAALEHPWLTYIDRPPPEPYRIPSEYLKNYHILYRDWYSNASCRTWYRRRKFSCAFEHPTKMIYPPGHRYTPEPEDRRYSPSKKPGMKSWEDHVLTREPIDTEIGMVKSEGHYQTGPDTYLLQLRDTDFPVRIREYMKVACNRSPGYSRSIAEDQNFDWRAPIIRERRRFTDVMDEEIDDERRERINRYGAADNFTTPRRLKHELGTRLESYVEADAMMESKKKGHPPFFREKPQIKPIEEGKRAYLTCLAVGDPKPSVQWYKNDIVIQESNRVKINEDPEGRSILSFNPAKEHDIGIYKVVARNPIGQSVVRTRVLLASVPSAPDSPEATEVSDTEVLLRWKQPKYDGNSAVLCYNLQYKEGDGIEWIDVASNIDHEFYVVKNLKEDTSYNFRLSARNRIGWSEHGIPTKLIKTKGEGSPKVQVTRAMKHLQQLTEGGQEIVLEEDKVHMDYSIEERPVEWCTESQLTNKYSFISELSRGQFSVVVKGIERSTNRVIVAKILDLGSSNEQEKQVNREYEALRSLRHERIALLEAAYKAPGSPIAVFVLEKLQGADVLSYFSSRHEFSENCVATVISQILDGLQYLHWRGLCHLDIQPDNVVMASVRSVQVKLVDFGSAKKISKLGSQVSKNGHPEYRAPEVYSDEMAYPQTDIWMVGVLTYVLLSGVSPFRGKDADETRQNITFVRYRFEHLFKELSQEATRFLMLVFKRAPSKRPVTEECHEHRWLMPTEYMIKKRERAVFLGNRLKEYSDEYHAEKLKLASQTESLATESILGSSRTLIRSTSIQDELLTTF